MYTRDLLTAQIETFSKLLAALILKRKGQALDYLEEDLLALSKHQLGIDMAEVIEMDEATFHQRVLASNDLSPEKKKLLGWALQEHAELQLSLSNTEHARKSSYKALMTYRHLLNQQNGIVYDLDMNFRFNFVKSLIDRLND